VLSNGGAARTVEHAYGSKQVQIDTEELRSLGYLPPAQEQRFVDQYRAIKRPILKNAGSDTHGGVELGNVLLVTSALAGEGKTFTCLNFCLSVAQEQDWSVVLVDGDNAKSHISRLFGAEQELGLVDALRDPNIALQSLIMPTNLPRFAFLPAGRRDEHAAELLASRRMSMICEQLSAQDSRRMIVFDSAPLLLNSESPVLAAQAGQVLMVVRAGHTPQKAVLAAREKLDPARAINLVLNQARFGSTAVSSDYGGYATYGS
jgi:exopolysaccharide/PEP-CTERM locus tyrosine autokinase